MREKCIIMWAWFVGGTKNKGMRQRNMEEGEASMCIYKHNVGMICSVVKHAT